VEGSFVDVEDEAESRYAVTKSDFESTVKMANDIHTRQEVKGTILQAKRWAESAEGESVITYEAASMVKKLYQKRSANGTASASAKSRSCLGWTFHREK
jgi:hypothetical protein